MKKNTGSITLYVLIAMMFFIIALISTFMVISNRANNEKELSKQVQDMYNTTSEDSIYNSYWGGDIVPIYNSEHFKKIDSGENIAINDEGGRIYNFTDSAKYVLRNDITIYAKDYGTDEIWEEIRDKLDLLENRFEDGGNRITVVLIDETAKVYGKDNKLIKNGSFDGTVNTPKLASNMKAIIFNETNRRNKYT